MRELPDIPGIIKTAFKGIPSALADLFKKIREALLSVPGLIKDTFNSIKNGEPARGPRARRRESDEERYATVLRQRIIIGIIAALLLFYLVRTCYSAFHFYDNSSINGIDVSGMSLREARAALIEKGADGYELTVKGPEGRRETVKGTDIDLRVIGAKAAKKCLRSQNAFAWITGGRKEKKYDIELEAEFDKDKLTAAADALDMLNASNMSEPIDAYLQTSESGVYEIVPEYEGTKLRIDEAEEIIADACGRCARTVDLAPAQYMPEIRSDNENLIKRSNEWNGYLAASGLTYNVAENEVVFDAVKIGYLLEDDGESVTLSMDKIKDLVAEWKYDYDTYSHQFEFTTYYGKKVMIQPYGNYGYEIDDETLPQDIYDRIMAGDRGSYEVPYYHKPPYDFNKGLGGNYVEVNIDLQHVWVWKDGEVVVDTDVVTGSPVYGRTTYHGCYAINHMERNVTLGDVNVEGYASEVSYWVRFNGGEGLHDAPWRENFGGRIWIYSGSHGCVNVPEWVMGDVYDNVELGEAVVVYGSEYDESVHTRGSGEVNTDYYEKMYDSGDLQY